MLPAGKTVSGGSQHDMRSCGTIRKGKAVKRAAQRSGSRLNKSRRLIYGNNEDASQKPFPVDRSRKMSTLYRIVPRSVESDGDGGGVRRLRHTCLGARACLC